MRPLKLKLCILTLMMTCSIFKAQNTEGVSIKSSATPPDQSAMLDVGSSIKGVLIPQVALQSETLTAPIATTPANSLLVYNTNSLTMVGRAGYYYWNGAGVSYTAATEAATVVTGRWERLSTSVPKMTFAQMEAMLTPGVNTPTLTLADRGMMVFVIDTDMKLLSENHFGPLTSGLAHWDSGYLKYYYVYGLWYLSSLWCAGTGGTAVHTLGWKYFENNNTGIFDSNSNTIKTPEGPGCPGGGQ